MNSIIKTSKVLTNKGVKFSCPKYSETSKIAQSENQDCVVRAAVTAFAISYDEAHKWCAEYFGRKNRRGTQVTAYRLEKETMLHGKKIEKFGRYLTSEERWDLDSGSGKFGMVRLQKRRGEIKVRKMTVGQFIKQNPLGTYFMLVRKHAFTIIDGVVYGNWSDGIQMRTRVESAFKIG